MKSSKLNLCRTYWYITRRKKSYSPKYRVLLNIAYVASIEKKMEKRLGGRKYVFSQQQQKDGPRSTKLTKKEKNI